MSIVVGMDIGGTKLLVESANLRGETLARRQAPTPLSLTEGLAVLETLVDECRDGVDIAGIGVSIGGPLDAATGIVSPLHQPEWRDVPLRQILQERYKSPVRIEVDTDAAALGEGLFSDSSTGRLLYITLSTGMGGGFLVDGAIYRGAGGAHPEIGHQAVSYRCRYPERIHCECGAPDCLEALVSGNGIRRIYGKPAEQLDADEWSEVAFNVGQGLRNASAFYAPDKVVLGGGVALGGGNSFVEAAAQVMRDYLHIVPAPDVALTRLGGYTAVRGAVALALSCRAGG